MVLCLPTATGGIANRQLSSLPPHPLSHHSSLPCLEQAHHDRGFGEPPRSEQDALLRYVWQVLLQSKEAAALGYQDAQEMSRNSDFLERSELEGTHKGCQVQLLCERPIQGSNLPWWVISTML